MLVQITKIHSESSWSSPEDKEFFEGKVFYIPDKENHLFTVDRKWENLPPITFLMGAELLKHKDLLRPTIPLYSFGSVEVKILPLQKGKEMKKIRIEFLEDNISRCIYEISKTPTASFIESLIMQFFRFLKG